MKKDFPSNKGLAMGILYLALSSIFFFLIGLPGIRTSNPILIVLWLLILSLFLMAWFGVRYIIENGDLKVKLGPFIERSIPIEEISTIHRSYELQSSSSGPSWRKLKVRFKGGDVLISPGREEEFLKTLKAVNPKIFIDLSMVIHV